MPNSYPLAYKRPTGQPMDVYYVLDQNVPHWADGVPLIQVVTPAHPDINTLLDSSLLHSFLPFYQGGFLPIDAMVKNFSVNCILHVLFLLLISVRRSSSLYNGIPVISPIYTSLHSHTWYSVHNPFVLGSIGRNPQW